MSPQWSVVEDETKNEFDVVHGVHSIDSSVRENVLGHDHPCAGATDSRLVACFCSCAHARSKGHSRKGTYVLLGRENDKKTTSGIRGARMEDRFDPK